MNGPEDFSGLILLAAVLLVAAVFGGVARLVFRWLERRASRTASAARRPRAVPVRDEDPDSRDAA